MIMPSLRTVVPAAMAAATVLSTPALALPERQAVPRQADGQQACNNSPSLCSKPYNKVTHMGAHNSAFVRDASTGNSVAGNQYYNATVALDSGIRLLQAQVHDEEGGPRLCHTLCELLDAGPLDEWMKTVADWMSNNPNEVVTMLLVNSDDLPAANFGQALKSSGLSKHSYVPDAPGQQSWPTLKQMIQRDERLVTYVASVDMDPAWPQVLDEFNYVFETPFEVTSLDGFNCTADRPTTYSSGSQARQAGMLGLVNHFAYDTITDEIMYPKVDPIATTNSPDKSISSALGNHAQRCQSEWGGGDPPTYMLVDFASEGPAVATADEMNGVSQPVGRLSSSDLAALDVAQGEAAPGAVVGSGKVALLVGLVGTLMLF